MRAADDQGQRAEEQAQASDHDLAAGPLGDSLSWVRVPTAKQQEYDGARHWAWAVLMQDAAEEGGC